MKKLTAKMTFDFPVDGQVVLHISPEGCLASDEQARLVAKRLPFVTVSEVTAPKEEVVEPAVDAKVPAAPKKKRTRKE